MPDQLQMSDVFFIGENDHGYRFGIAKIGGGERWIGFACESAVSMAAKDAFSEQGLPVDPSMIFVISAVSEGYELGLLDKDQAIKLTGAIAQDPESAYGGISRWFVSEELRGKPEDFRCEHCERVGCNGQDCQEDYDHEDLGP